MDFTMAIAATSVNWSLAKVQQEVDISLLKKAMGAETEALEMITQNLEAAGSSFGHQLDILA